MGEFSGIWLADVGWGRAIGKAVQGLALILQLHDNKAQFHQVYTGRISALCPWIPLTVIQRVFHKIPPPINKMTPKHTVGFIGQLCRRSNWKAAYKVTFISELVHFYPLTGTVFTALHFFPRCDNFTFTYRESRDFTHSWQLCFEEW